MKNVACRIFKEQIDLINELPKEDRANVLYNAIMSAYNQFENQTENQIEYAYISLSISKSIFNLLSKNIVFKEYNNYGGKRENSGRPKNNQLENQKNQKEQTETKNINIKQKLKTENIIDFESLFTYWEQNKKGGKYKPESRQRMLNKLKELTNNNFEYAKKAIFYAIDNNYQGFTDGSKLYYREKPKEEIFEPVINKQQEQEYILAEITKKKLEQEMIKKWGVLNEHISQTNDKRNL